MASSSVKIAEGKNIKVPSALLNRFKKEVKVANQILKSKRAQARKTQRANNNYAINLRHEDIKLFKRKSTLLKYFKTTHDIITGKFFENQLTNYRNNLISSMLKNWGVDIGETKITSFNIGKLRGQITPKEYSVISLIATMSKQDLSKLESSDRVNLVQYMYAPQENNTEHLDYMIDLLNSGKIFDDKGTFNRVFEYQSKRGLNK